MAYTDQQIADYAKKLEAAGAPPEKIREFVSKAKAEQNPPKQEGMVTSALKSVAGAVVQPIQTAVQTLVAPFEFGARTAGKVAEGKPVLESAIEAQKETSAPKPGLFGTEYKGIESPRELIGEAAQLASFLPFGRGAKIGYETLTGSVPIMKGLLNSVGAGAASGALGSGGMALSDTEASLPEVALSTVAGGVAGSVLGAGGSLAATGLKAAKSKLFPNLEKEAMDAVTNAIKRGIQPPTRKVTTAGETEKYYSQASEAFADIATRRGKLNLTNEFGEEAGELPQTVAQLSQAVDQAKRAVFEGYDTLNKLAGTSGRELPTAPIVAELRQLAQDERLLRYNPSAAKYATRLASDLERRGSFSLSDAQDELQFLNEGLKRLYGARDVSSTNKIWIDKFLADRLRGGLDAVIDSETGQSYQGLRNMYRNYKTIEDDVNHRAAVLLRGAKHGLPDFLNIQSVGDVVIGLASGQPAFVASGVAQKALNSYYKYLNSPNQAIANAFKALIKTTGKTIKEEEAVKKGIQVKMQKKPPLALPEARYIPSPPTGGYSGGATVSQGGGAAPITQMSQNEAKQILVKKGAITPEQGAPSYKNKSDYAPKVPPQSAAGVAAGIEPEYDENGNIKGYKIDPAKAALGVLLAGTLGKNSKTFKEIMQGKGDRIVRPEAIQAFEKELAKVSQKLAANKQDLADAYEFLDYARAGGKMDIVKEQRGNELLKKYLPLYSGDDALGVRADAIEGIMPGAVSSNSKKMIIREGGEIGGTKDLTARQRFDLPSLLKISFGGSDRDVYDLGDGSVLKVAKTSRGLDQNQYSSDYYAEDVGLIPKTLEAGRNYVVKEKVDPPDQNVKKMVGKLSKINTAMGFGSPRAKQERIDEAIAILEEHGYPGGELYNYGDILWGDMKAVRNWGTRDGKPVMLDEGTLNGSLIKNAKKNSEDYEFQAIKRESRAAKKRYGDTDKKTAYGLGAITAAGAASSTQNKEIKVKKPQ